ncbi:MAG: FAD-binding oxidoreductase [Vulcanimicrobiaceae bacterium]
MAQLTLSVSDGTRIQIDQTVIEALGGAEVFVADSPGYDEARVIWNGMIDRRPGVIVRCLTSDDIRAAVTFAKTHGLLTAVRGGGHNIAGNAVCEGGVVIDLSSMKGITVDPQGRTAVVEAGVTLGEFDKACQAHGLATPTGINSTTGIAGLTLGGGFGWLSRKYGLTIDNLISAQVVTADGGTLTASATENPDLFWGIRGGGGNFGIVSAFTYRLDPVGPEVLAGLIVHPMADAPKLLRDYREFCATTPDDVTAWVVMRKAPPLPFLPDEWHGKEVLVFAVCCAGDIASGEAALKPLRELGKPIADVIGPQPFVGWQTAFDPLLAPGARNYWKSHDFAELTDGAIDAIIDSVGKLPSPHCEIFIGQMGGAPSRVAPDATAYLDRNVKFIMNVHGRWETEAEDAVGIAWCRSTFDAATPYATGGAYVNFLTAEEVDRVPAAYGSSYQRLVELKRKYDPTNLFCMNQNIKP